MISSRVMLLYFVFTTTLLHISKSGSPPVIKEHPKDITARKNDPTTLKCGVSEGSDVRWFRNGQPIKGRSHRYILMDNGSLFFLRVTDGKKESDSGVYWCIASNEFGSARSHNATLSVATLDATFQLEPTPLIQGRRGDPLTISCRPPLGTPTPAVRWKYNGQVITNNSRLYTILEGDLVFERVSEKDSGTYVCLAQNMAGVKESRPSTLSVIYPPLFEEVPQNQTAIAGSSIEFTCNAKGNPSPKVAWRRLDGKMPLSRTQVTSHTLLIKDISASDSGTYICDAKNDAGTASAQALLNVVAAPVVGHKPNNVLTLIGEDATVSCQVTGDPEPLILWRLPFRDHSSHLLAGETSNRASISEDGTLFRMHNLQPSDTGLYQCWGISTGGGVSSIAKIAVVESFPPPLIGVMPQDLELSIGSSATFPCEVVSEMSDPTISWHFQRASHLPSRKIIPKAPVSILATGALVIKHVSHNDAGIYKCRVDSKSGTVEAEALLKIKEGGVDDFLHRPLSVPAPPSKPKIMAFNSSSVLLNWLPNSRRDPSIETVKYTVEYWRTPWQEWRVALTDIPEEACTVTDLVANTAYIFLIRAVDHNGESFPSPWSNMVYTNKPDDPNLTLEGERQARRRLNKPSVSLSSVRTMTADTVILSWTILEGSEMELDGVIIYTISEGIIHTSTVLGEASSSYVRDLQPNRQYTFFLVPFWRTIQGVPSNLKIITTPEETPRISPRGFSVEMFESGTVLLRWDPLSTAEARGNLIGYQVSFYHNGSSFVEETPTPWLEAKNLAPGRLYIVKVAGVTGAGVGPWSAPEPLTISDAASSSQRETGNGETEDGPSVYYPPPHPAWLLYLIVPAVVLLIIGGVLYLKKFRRKPSPASLEQNSGTNIYPDSSLYTPHAQHVNMYSEQKLWRPSDSDKDSSISSARLLRPEHLVNEYAEPRIHRLNDTAEPYATTALLAAPSTPRIGRTPPSWRHGRCSDENGIQVNWAAILPPPPACPPPPNFHLEGESCSSVTTSSESSDRRCYSPPSQYDNNAASEQYEHPCDMASEHTYAAYSPVASEVAPPSDSFHTFCTLQGHPVRRVRLDCNHPTCSEPPKSNTH